MKSIVVFFCFVILFSSAAYGEVQILGKPYTFSLTFQPGFIYGTSYEIVYQNGISDDYLSELQWDLKPLYFIGTELSIVPVKNQGFFAGLGIKAGLPGDTGSKENRDWDGEVDPSGNLTHFSSHTNRTQTAILIDSYAGFSFSITDWFFIRPFMSFDYYYFKMEARDGYYSYKTNNWEKIPLSGPVVRYSQYWYILSPGLSFGFTMDRFTINSHFKITPIIWCIGIDEHLRAEKRITYRDYMSGRLALEPALDLSFALTPRVNIGINALYRYITGTRGNSYREGNKIITKSDNTGGASLKLFESSLYLKLNF